MYTTKNFRTKKELKAAVDAYNVQAPLYENTGKGEMPMKTFSILILGLLTTICYNTAPKDIAFRQTEFMSMPTTAPTLKLAFDVLSAQYLHNIMVPIDQVTWDAVLRCAPKRA